MEKVPFLSGLLAMEAALKILAIVMVMPTASILYLYHPHQSMVPNLGT